MQLGYYIIEFLDELVFGVIEAAKPAFRTDLSLSYTQIGLLVFLPNLVSSILEPIIGILGDTWRRKILILGGGVFFGVSLLLIAVSQNFLLLIISFCLLFPASVAFVTLSQATLMDEYPDRRERNMARWTLAGSLGVFFGPIILGSLVILKGDWRKTLIICSILVLMFVLIKIRKNTSYFHRAGTKAKPIKIINGIKIAINSFLDQNVIRWLVLLEFSDLLMDVLFGFLALYLVDVAGFNNQYAILGLSVWTGVGLLGDAAIIPLLEKVDGINYLRISIILALMIFPVFLLSHSVLLKLGSLALLGLSRAGWYSILQGKLYGSMIGKSGTVMALQNFSGIIGKLIPLGIGLTADQFGLKNAMWLLLIGPLVILIGLPKR